MKVARVLAIPHVVDGDTVWAQLEYTVGETLNGRELLERDYLGGSKCRITRKEITLDTPELNSKDPAERVEAKRAREDVIEWWDMAFLPVTTEIIGEDSFGRELSDMIDARGNSLTRYMRGKGWPGWSS